ncbi:MAG TPA: ATP-binding protein [Yinghuangia sp.]|nr:ATP-binding protein [Yinghuangia sp.]
MSAIRSRASEGGDPRGAGVGLRQVRRLPFGAEPGAVRRARTFLRTAMQAYGWRPAADQATELAADDIVLVAVELVTNACLHGGGPIELRVVRYDGGVRVEVDDRTEARPEPRDPFAGLRTGGHGLLIVRRLSREWGAVVRPGQGKTVWADLAEPGRDTGAAPDALR